MADQQPQQLSPRLAQLTRDIA